MCTSKPIYKEELEAIKRYRFHQAILARLEAHETVRFLLRKRQLNLFEISMPHEGEFHFGTKGNGKYTYKFSDFASAMDQIFDGIANDEVNIEFIADEIDLSWETDGAWKTQPSCMDQTLGDVISDPEQL